MARAVFAHTRIDLRQYHPHALAKAVHACADARQDGFEGLMAALHGPQGHASAWDLAGTLETLAWTDAMALPPAAPQLTLLQQRLGHAARADGTVYRPRVWVPACPGLVHAERVRAWLDPAAASGPASHAAASPMATATWLATGAPRIAADRAGDTTSPALRPSPSLQWRRHRALHEPAPGMFDLVLGHALMRSAQAHVRRRLLQQLLGCLSREGLLWVDADSMADAFAMGWQSAGVIGLLQRPALQMALGREFAGAAASAPRATATTAMPSWPSTPRQDTLATAGPALATELPRALAAGELVLHYQPQFDVASGHLTGAEALVRWQHPQRGLTMPDAFIHGAETLGLIDQLGDWVLATGCRQLAEWRRGGLAAPRLAVNVSGLQLKKPRFFTRLAELLADAGLPASMLELELTESALLPTSGAQLAALAQCRQAGIGLCLDDFGTGHATMGALHQLPVDRLKIDRSFIRNLPADLTGQAIVRAAIGLSRELQLDVVAEGVETTGQLDFLRRNACRGYQGFLRAPALPAAEFAPWLQATGGDGAAARALH